MAPPCGQLGITSWIVFTGSRSSGSNSSDSQKESDSIKQEVSAPPDKQLVAESPSHESTRRPQTSLSGLHGNSDSKDPLPAPSPSRAQRHDLSTSRQSFCLAMGNPSDFFVDVM